MRLRSKSESRPINQPILQQIQKRHLNPEDLGGNRPEVDVLQLHRDHAGWFELFQRLEHPLGKPSGGGWEVKDVEKGQADECVEEDARENLETDTPRSSS